MDTATEKLLDAIKKALEIFSKEAHRQNIGRGIEAAKKRQHK